MGQPSCQSSSLAPDHGTNGDWVMEEPAHETLGVFSHSERRAQISCSYFQPWEGPEDRNRSLCCLTLHFMACMGMEGSIWESMLAEGWDKPLVLA